MKDGFKIMQKKFKLLLIIFGFLFLIGIKSCFAQVNPEMIQALNELFISDVKLMQQCESNREEFSLFIVYNQIISEKQQTLRDLAELIDSFGADISDKILEVEKQIFKDQALINNAKSQIKIISMYDDILSKFGHPKVQIFAKKAKNQAIIHYMLFSTTIQQVIADNHAKEIIQN